MKRLPKLVRAVIAGSALSITACVVDSEPSSTANPSEESTPTDVHETAFLATESLEHPRKIDTPRPPESVATDGQKLGPSPAAAAFSNCSKFLTGYTPWFGGDGGANQFWQHQSLGGSHQCAVFTGVVYGARVVTNTYVVAIQLAWYEPNRSDLLYATGDAWGTSEIRGSDYPNAVGHPWEYCPTGSIVVGVEGTHDGTLSFYVNSVGFACKSLTTGAITFLTTWAGSIGRTPFSYGCDWSNSALFPTNNDSFDPARVGAVVDGFALECNRPRSNTVFWLQ